MSVRHLVLLAGLSAAACAAPADYPEHRSLWQAQAGPPEQAGEAPALTPDSGLRAYTTYALVRHAGLQAAFQRWKAALERVPQAASLPDPRLSFSAAVLDAVETRNGPVLGTVGLSQAFPWFGTLAAAASGELEAAEAAREDFEALRLAVTQELRDTWYEYSYLRQALKVTEGNLELLRYLETVARSRYEVGAGTHADVIRAQVEMGKLEDQLATLRDLRLPLVARLNAILNRPADAGIPWPEEALPAPPGFEDAALRAGLAETQPLLRAQEHRRKAAEYGIELAEKAFYPGFVLGGQYTFIGSTRLAGAPEPGGDAFGVSLSLDLPIWGARNRAGLREAEARRAESAATFSDLANRITADLEMALYKVRDGDRRVALFRDTLIPKGEESLQATASAYETGNATFLDYVDAQRVLLDFQLSAARAEADRAQALALAERLTGVRLIQEP